MCSKRALGLLWCRKKCVCVLQGQGGGLREVGLRGPGGECCTLRGITTGVVSGQQELLFDNGSQVSVDLNCK